MSLDDLSKHLSNPARIGLNEELQKKLGIATADATRGRLMAEVDDNRGHLGVYLLAAYVIDDTDLWGDGEIYWWSIPVLQRKGNKAQKSVLHTLPIGEAPHKVGSLEWMTNLSLSEPALLAAIPPDDSIESCVIRLAFYDDDGAVADVPKAMTAGLEALAEISNIELTGTEQIITPVRDAIWKSLRAEQDDILIDQDVALRRGEVGRFGAGMVGSIVNSMIRVYYFVKDEQKTEQFGPIMLHKGQVENVKFKQALKGGGRLALFARGADITCASFGDLSTDLPFQNRIIDARNEGGLEQGFNVQATGPAKLIAYYTPPA